MASFVEFEKKAEHFLDKKFSRIEAKVPFSKGFVALSIKRLIRKNVIVICRRWKVLIGGKW
ncbi:hypothetical protein [Bacillus sp. OV166]|uniref:hypothetical protein n=1 Tax=Bacillus sp. OV166 TaxID=1882763 RepID=UPI000B4482B5|nr:hypothetical protein [Bacillus sp. OV166]